jgi:hypothetical protein
MREKRCGCEDWPDVRVGHPLRPVIPSEQQIADRLGVVTRESGFRIFRRFVAPGYPKSEVVHLVRTSGR